MTKLYDLLNILRPRTRIKLIVKLSKSSFDYEASLSDFRKSRYYQIFWNEPVTFDLSGGALNGFVVEITVNGGLPDDI